MDAAEKSDCTRESEAVLRKDSADCKAQYFSSLKDVGIDKEERKLVAAELAECLKKARAKERSLRAGCAMPSGFD